MKLERFAGNPILEPHPDHAWEDLAVFNPAAWYDEQKREVLVSVTAATAASVTQAFVGPSWLR